MNKHDPEMCFCRKCVERLLADNEIYFKAWLDYQNSKERKPDAPST